MSRFSVRDPYASEPAGRPGRRGGVCGDGEIWVKGQLHAHTSRSVDGRMTPEAVVAAYRARGFDFLCITDHDRVWPACSWEQGLLVVPGEESTLARPLPPLGRHLLRLFVSRPVSLLAGSSAKMDATVRAGGLLAAAHPAWSGNLGTGRWRLEALRDPRLTLVEIVNHHSPTRDNLALWDAALAARGPASPLWATAVDDSHREDQVGRAWIWVRVERPLHTFSSPHEAARHLREALARGAFYPSTGARARFWAEFDGMRAVVRVEVERPQPDAAAPISPAPPVVRFVGAGGRRLAEAPSWQSRYPVRGDEGYVRVEVELPDGSAAWSQPFWIVPATGG